MNSFHYNVGKYLPKSAPLCIESMRWVAHRRLATLLQVQTAWSSILLEKMKRKKKNTGGIKTRSLSSFPLFAHSFIAMNEFPECDYARKYVSHWHISNTSAKRHWINRHSFPANDFKCFYFVFFFARQNKTPLEVVTLKVLCVCVFWCLNASQTISIFVVILRPQFWQLNEKRPRVHFSDRFFIVDFSLAMKTKGQNFRYHLGHLSSSVCLPRKTRKCFQEKQIRCPASRRRDAKMNQVVLSRKTMIATGVSS